MCANDDERLEVCSVTDWCNHCNSDVKIKHKPTSLHKFLQTYVALGDVERI